MAVANKDDIILEIDGPDVHPTTVDARTTLDLAAAYLETLQKIAMDDEAAALSFKGIFLEDKCAQVRFIPSNHSIARAVQQVAIREAAEGEPRVRRLREALRKLPDEYQVRAIIAGQKVPLTTVEDLADKPAYAATTLRAKLLRAGGLERPTAQFLSASESRSFSVRVDTEVARELGRHLYGEMDIEVLVSRDLDGNITSGTLVEYHPVSDEDPVEAWRAWYAEHGVKVSELDAYDDNEGPPDGR